MANIQTGNFGDLITTLYEKRALTSASPRLIHSRWARDAQWVGQNTYQLYRYDNLDAVLAPLAEGVTPPEAAAPTLTTVTLTPEPYGAWLGYTQEINLTAFAPVVSQTSQLLGRQAGLSVDTLVRNTLHVGATIEMTGPGPDRINIAAGDVIDYNDVVNQMAQLMAEDAMPSDGGTYAVIIHPLTLAVLLNDVNFMQVFALESVKDSSSIRGGRVGRLFNFDFYVSSNAIVYAGQGAAGIDVYAALFIGGESYGMAGFTGFYPQMSGFEGSGEYDNMTGKFASPIQIIVRDLGETGFDPLKQRGTIGWLLYEDDVVLNDAWIRSFEHAVV